MDIRICSFDLKIKLKNLIINLIKYKKTKVVKFKAAKACKEAVLS